MRKHFDDQIAQLGEQMMAMGALVENTIERAIRALQTDDMAEAAAIRDGDHIVDEKERFLWIIIRLPCKCTRNTTAKLPYRAR